MDHPSLLAASLLLTPDCYLFSLGSITELDEVTPCSKKSIFNIIRSLMLLGCSCRYAFSGSSGDSSGEFEKDDYTLTLIKPSPVPSHEVKNLSEARSLQVDTEEPEEDLEEDKRE